MSIDRRADGVEDVTSPELVLVDPDLRVLARSRLPDDFAAHNLAPRPQPVETVPIAMQLVRVRHALRGAGQGSDRRLLVGCAVVTTLVLLLLDLHVHVRTEPATKVAGAPPPTFSASGSRPSKTPSIPIERRFVWAKTPNASGYHVEFFHRAERVFVRNTVAPEVLVPAAWTYGGRRRSLRAGPYTWYVWPIVAGRRATTAVVQATVSIPD